MKTLTNGAGQPAVTRLSSIASHAVAVDVALLTIQDTELKALLIKREREPFAGRWALPGSLVHPEESVDAAALRTLQEKSHIGPLHLEQLYTFGDPLRDPRERVITVTYYAVVHQEHDALREQRNGNAAWFPVRKLPKLAFDHENILRCALGRLQAKINYTTIAFQLLPERFTLSDLQHAYEIILGEALDKRNFRRKMLQLGILEETDDRRANGRQRPARLYRFTKNEVITLQEKGLVVPFRANTEGNHHDAH